MLYCLWFKRNNYRHKQNMNNRILNISILSALVIGSSLIAKDALAAVRCETQYGGGEVCVKTGKLQIDKKIKFNGNLFDNLFGGDAHKYVPGEEIEFKLSVKNVGDETFSSVQVKDMLPSILELKEVSVSYKTEGLSSFAYEIKDLTVGETEEATIKAKVVSADKLTDNSICDVNTAEATSGNDSDKDTAKFCVVKQVLGVTPVTGPETGLVVMFASLLIGLSGLVLVRFPKLLTR